MPHIYRLHVSGLCLAGQRSNITRGGIDCATCGTIGCTAYRVIGRTTCVTIGGAAFRMIETEGTATKGTVPSSTRTFLVRARHSRDGPCKGTIVPSELGTVSLWVETERTCGRFGTPPILVVLVPVYVGK